MQFFRRSTTSAVGEPVRMMNISSLQHRFLSCAIVMVLIILIYFHNVYWTRTVKIHIVTSEESTDPANLEIIATNTEFTSVPTAKQDRSQTTQRLSLATPASASNAMGDTKANPTVRNDTGFPVTPSSHSKQPVTSVRTHQSVTLATLVMDKNAGQVGHTQGVHQDKSAAIGNSSLPVHSVDKHSIPEGGTDGKQSNVAPSASETASFVRGMSAELRARLTYLEQATEGRNTTLARLSFNPDIIARGKFQQQRVDDFCARTKYSSVLSTNEAVLDSLYHHLLYDDSKKIVFCYVPKNGCSNMKHMMLILTGVIPPSAVKKRPPASALRKAQSFRTLHEKGDQTGIEYRLKNYYKAAIVRQPMQRLASAFRNKLEPPLNFTNRGKFPDSIKRDILSLCRQQEMEQYRTQMRQKQPAASLKISFSNLVSYMITAPERRFNEHFTPSIELCLPCAIKYDFYGNFASVDYDIYAVMEHLGIPSAYYPQKIHKPAMSTEEYARRQFQQLPKDDYEQLLQVFKDELDFFHSLYPVEEGES